MMVGTGPGCIRPNLPKQMNYAASGWEKDNDNDLVQETFLNTFRKLKGGQLSLTP